MEILMQKRLLKTSCLILPLCFANPVAAELVTYEVSATVYDVYDPDNVLQGSIAAGNTISGTYTFELSAPDEDPSPEYARYNQLNTPGFELLINSQTIQSDDTLPEHMHEIYVGNSVSDYFHAISWGNTPLSAGAIVSDIGIDLYDPNGLALNSTGLSTTAPDISAFSHKDLFLVGNNSTNNYFNVIASIDNLKNVSQTNTHSNIVKFTVKAVVKDVYDPAGALNGGVVLGDVIDGGYTFNITTPDEEPMLEVGRYVHRPGSGQYGFDLSVGNIGFKTDSNSVDFVLDLYNGIPSPDHYGAFSYGTNYALPNGATVEDIGLHLYDDTGNMLSSTQLSNTPPVFSDSTSNSNEIYIWGMHPNGWDMYNIVAQIQEIKVADAEQSSLVALSPASGIFDRAQRFDLAIIFEPNLDPLMDQRVSINGYDQTPSLYDCIPGAPNSQNRFTLVCPDYSQFIGPMLLPGKNRLDFHFTLGDGTIIDKSVEWEMLDF